MDKALSKSQSEMLNEKLAGRGLRPGSSLRGSLFKLLARLPYLLRGSSQPRIISTGWEASATRSGDINKMTDMVPSQSQTPQEARDNFPRALPRLVDDFDEVPPCGMPCKTREDLFDELDVPRDKCKNARNNDPSLDRHRASTYPASNAPLEAEIGAYEIKQAEEKRLKAEAVAAAKAVADVERAARVEAEKENKKRQTADKQTSKALGKLANTRPDQGARPRKGYDDSLRKSCHHQYSAWMTGCKTYK